MPDERTPIAPGDRTEAALKSIQDSLNAFRLDTHGRLSSLEAGFSQMDKRISSVESLQRWAIGLIITSWFTLVGLIVTLMMRVR